jgi:Domain of Unknown Function (DUF928)
MITLFYKMLLGATATGALVLTANLAAHANLSPQEEEISPTEIAVQFNLPNDATPSTSIGGGTRGNVQFALPDGATPNTSIGGGIRGNVQFALPDGATPNTSIGGGIRGNAQFALPDGATPNTSIGGGTRGDRLPLLTALVPPTQHGNTVSGRPTIFAYLPPMGAGEVFFSMQDEEGNSFYHTTLPVSSEGGTIAITLPAEAPELEMGKNYLWYLAPLEPGALLRPDNHAVMGWIKRVESTVNDRSLASSPVELATAYANAGVWYDTLEVLASAQRSEPGNKTLATEWSELLQQVGLEAIASQPLADRL